MERHGWILINRTPVKFYYKTKQRRFGLSMLLHFLLKHKARTRRLLPLARAVFCHANHPAPAPGRPFFSRKRHEVNMKRRGERTAGGAP
jgi:hypothetical protein